MPEVLTEPRPIEESREKINRPAPPLKVFISYKSRDAAAALDVKNKMETLSAHRIEVFVSCSPDSLPPAANWRAKISRELRDAHALLFLYTDPKQTWDWCFYETGFFDGSRTESPGLYVLHSQGTAPPKPLESLQAVEILPEDNGGSDSLDDLLDTLFRKSTEPAVSEDYKKDQDMYGLLRSAIRKPFSRPTTVPQPKSFMRRIQLIVPQKSTKALSATGAVPADSQIVGDDLSMALFNRTRREEGWPWSEIESELKANSIQQKPELSLLWVHALGQAMKTALSSRIVASGLPFYFCSYDMKAYRPSLSALSYDSAGNAEFEVVFVDLPPELEAYPPDALGKTAHLINLARMFRWGALLPSRKQFDASTEPDELNKIGNCFLHSLNNITAECLNRGIRRQFDVLSAFDAKQREELKNILDAWPSLFEGLQSAIKDGNGKEMEMAMDEMLRMNRCMLRASTARFAELIEEMAKEEEEGAEVISYRT